VNVQYSLSSAQIRNKLMHMHEGCVCKGYGVVVGGNTIRDKNTLVEELVHCLWSSPQVDRVVQALGEMLAC